jgi:hypothetical protein
VGDKNHLLLSLSSVPPTVSVLHPAGMPPALQAAQFRFTAVAAPRAGRPALQDKLYTVQDNSPLKKALPFLEWGDDGSGGGNLTIVAAYQVQGTFMMPLKYRDDAATIGALNVRDLLTSEVRETRISTVALAMANAGIFSADKVYTRIDEFVQEVVSTTTFDRDAHSVAGGFFVDADPFASPAGLAGPQSCFSLRSSPSRNCSRRVRAAAPRPRWPSWQL